MCRPLRGALLQALFEGSDRTEAHLVPGLHRCHGLPRKQCLDVGHHIARVVVGDAGGPARANALSAVQQHQRQDGHVPAGRRIRFHHQS